MKSFEGYLKRKLGDNYVLLAGGRHKELNSFAFRNAWNDLIHSGNEFTFASAAYDGGIYINYRTASGNKDGNITSYLFCNGKGGTLATISSGLFSGNAATASNSTKLGGKALSEIFETLSRPENTNDISITIGGVNKTYSLGSMAFENKDNYALSTHTHNYLPIAQVTEEQNINSNWGKTYAESHRQSLVYNTSGREWAYWIGMRSSDLGVGTILRLSHDGLVQYAHKAGGGAGQNWSTWKDIITSDNIDSQTVSKANTWTNGRTLTIGSTGKSVDGSKNVSWTLAEIGAATANHNHNGVYLDYGGDVKDIGSNAPIANAKSWVTTTNLPNAFKILYDSAGYENTLLYTFCPGSITANSSGIGTILKWGAWSTYMYIARNTGNNWQSTDWEKISAGYADFAGSVAWASVSSKPATATRWPTWDEVTSKPSSFTPATHTHGLTNSSFFISMPSQNSNKTWKNSFGYNMYSNLLMSVRINSPAPEWCVGNYGSGILYGGADTKGFMSSSYGTPKVMWAGGYGNSSDAVPKWYFGITGTSGTIYNLNSMPYASSAGSVAWSNVSSKPETATRWPSWSEVTSKPFNWSGQSGQPTWLWGSNDGTNYYVWNPSNFSVNYAGYAGKVSGSYTWNGGQQNPNYFGTNRVGFLMMNTTVNGNSQFKDWVIMDCYSGNDVGGGVAIGVNRQSLGAYIMRSAAARTSWEEKAELLGTHNSSVSLSGSTLTVKIAGVEKSLTNTNTWRGIQDNLTSSTNTTESLSAKQGYLLANGSARDNTKLPLAGGAMTGSIIMSQGASARNVGIIGTYDYTKAAAIWTMGASYQIPAAGNNLGSLYGAAYVYQGLAGLGTMAGGHQFVWAENGVAKVALGNAGVWTTGGFKKNGSSDSYVLLGGGGHKHINDFILPLNTSPAATISTGKGTWQPLTGRYVFQQHWIDSSTGSDTADLGIFLDGNLTANMVLNGYYFTLSGYKVSGKDNNSILLAGGGTKAVSDFAISGHNHNSSYVSAVTISENYLRITKNGSNTDLTIPYSSNSGSLEGNTLNNVVKRNGSRNCVSIKPATSGGKTSISGFTIVAHPKTNQGNTYYYLKAMTDIPTGKYLFSIRSSGFSGTDHWIFYFLNSASYGYVDCKNGWSSAIINMPVAITAGSNILIDDSNSSTAANSDTVVFSEWMLTPIDEGTYMPAPEDLVHLYGGLTISGTLTASSFIKSGSTSSKVLLGDGSDKNLSDFIGSLNWDSTNKKIQYKKIGDSSWRDLADISAAFTDNNTWRKVIVAGTERLGNANTTGDLKFVSGTYTTVTWNDTNKTIQYDCNLIRSGTASSLTGLDVTKSFIYVTLSASVAASAFTLSSAMSTGQCLTVLIYNSGSAAISITVPSSWKSLDGYNLTCGATKFLEISIVCYASNSYILSSKAQ